MFKIAICDDEATALSLIKKYLKEYAKAEFAIDEFASGEALLKSSENYEIILLDIDMPGQNGIETAKCIRNRNKMVKIIYITNYSDYTTFAFAVHAFAYLLKPVRKSELYQQLDEALEYMQTSSESLLEIHTVEGILRINPKDILYFEYLNRKVYLRTGKESYALKRKITELATELTDKGFFMPHKSFVVNLYAVKNIKGYDIYLTNSTIVPLSQKKSIEFRRALNHYLSEGIGLTI
ncbi:MAG: LytR/AlgR family response regulator transcription factor [Velocimicrobium sp.]